MKILYAASTGGHIEAFHLPYIRWLCERGDEVHVASPTPPKGLPDGVRYIELPLEKQMQSLKNFRAASAFARRIREERYDVISLHTALAAFFVRLAVIFAGGRHGAYVVNTVHGYLFGDGTPCCKKAVLLMAEKLTARVTDRVVVMNKRDLGLARRYRLSRGDILPVAGMGVEFSHFSPPSPSERKAAREAFGFDDKDVVFVYTAEFSARKNQAFLIRALPELPNEVKLLFAGDGALTEDCRALAAELGVEKRVVFAGYMSNVCDALYAADAFVSSSRSEGLPFGMMEAMHTGLPTLASAVAGQTDLIRNGFTGFLFKNGDKKALIGAAVRLTDPKRRARFGARARAAVEKYSLERVFAQNAAALGYVRDIGI